MNAENGPILVLDDDPSVLFGLAAYLEDEGYDVVTASTGEEALKLTDAHQPEIAIIDMRLPGMDGNAVILAAHGRHPGMKFIILTGSPDYLIPEGVRRLGISPDDVIHKPLTDMAEIVRAIHRLQAEE